MIPAMKVSRALPALASLAHAIFMFFGDPIIFNSVDRPMYNKLLIRPIVKHRV
jgi:hypothetical protein